MNIQRIVLASLTLIFSYQSSLAQFGMTPAQRDSLNKLTRADHKQMLKQLGITRLRPGANGNENAPDHANYDESLANPCPDLPEALISKNGKRITTADKWNTLRRPELIEEFENEVYGKLPKNIPAVKWVVDIEDHEFVGRIPVLARKVRGIVDNSLYSAVKVEIDMMLVLPENVKGPVPVLMMFGRPQFPSPAQPSADDYETLNKALKEIMVKEKPELQAVFDRYPVYQPLFRAPGPNFFAPTPTGDSPGTEQLLAAGWGYCTIDPASIQADNGAGLTKGIIGLVNKGEYRKPDDWGALRAWAWGAARGLDFLETIPEVDAKKVGIEGVSRYGKAALVTLAFESRFAIGLIGSSGKGGVVPHRRDFGEKVENLSSSGEYHWMAGNYIKYAAEESVFGRKTGCDLPVDSHQLIALAAPRLCFVSYGVPEKGDAKWLDQKGSYASTVAAGEVYKLLGVKDLGVSNDYKTEIMPPVETSLLDGNLAWRQHTGGHTDQPNFQFFIPWASQKLGYIK